jgi:hypothetical protein
MRSCTKCLLRTVYRIPTEIRGGQNIFRCYPNPFETRGRNVTVCPANMYCCHTGTLKCSLSTTLKCSVMEYTFCFTTFMFCNIIISHHVLSITKTDFIPVSNLLCHYFVLCRHHSHWTSRTKCTWRLRHDKNLCYK